MNGRVYDPLLANFLSPDPFIQSPENVQNFNRYTYCLNNPLKYTDPTGYKRGWLKELWNKIFNSNGSSSNTNSSDTSTDSPETDDGTTSASFENSEWENTFALPEVIVNPERPFGIPVTWRAKDAVTAANGGGSYTSSDMFKQGMYWASALLRMKYNMPADAYSVAGNIDIVGIAGADMSFPGKLWVTNGNDRGKSTTMFDFGIAGGYDVGASVVMTTYYYVGDINQLKIGDFEGSRWSVSGGFSFVLELGGGFMVAPVPGKGYIIGKMVHIGVSLPGPSGNINWGQTIFY